MKDNNLPVHVGIIMDGNGRWAKQRGLARNAGHKKGADVLVEIAQYAFKIGIKHLTVFAFSTENFQRPKEEVEGIFDLMRSFLKDKKKEKNDNVRLNFLGDITQLPQDIINDVTYLEDITKNYTEHIFNIAFNYGGRQDILQAAKALATLNKNSELNLTNFTEEDFSQLLYTKDQPDMDLMIRTSGEMRISNFLLWQAAYAEFIFSNDLWPDYTTKTFDRDLEVYRSRNRRLGAL